MNESFREHRPLLYDDSDEEQFPPRTGKKFRVSSLREDVNYKIKGAAAIISRWPDHWSSVLYWWIVLGMIVITVMVICNIMLTFAFVPSPYSFNKQTSIARSTKEMRHTSQSNNVYMHVFMSNNEEQVLNKYLPYLNKIIDEFSEFKFNFVVVLNDVMAHHNALMQNNEITMNHLEPNIIHKRAAINYTKNIEVQRICLTEYLDASPLKKHWRDLSPKLIPFLVRVVSIWEKGGVSFNPTISRLSNTNYYNNILKVLSRHSTKLLYNYTIEPKWQGSINNQVNNIQDIIENLDKDNHFDESLEEAENGRVIEKVTAKRHIDNAAVEMLSRKNESELDHASSPITKRNPNLDGEKDIIDYKYNEQFINQPAAVEIAYTSLDNNENINDQNVILTIDVHGDMIETNVQCHAFIGQIFTDIAHYSQNNVTDFIIKELSLFCKGGLLPCKGRAQNIVLGTFCYNISFTREIESNYGSKILSPAFTKLGLDQLFAILNPRFT